MTEGSEEVGVVLGTQASTPLDFWVGVDSSRVVQLDDLIVVETVTPAGEEVSYYGMVTEVRKLFEGQTYDTDAFRVAEGTLPVEVSYAAHVQVTRIDPEVFTPPNPGTPAQVVRGEAYQKALYFDQMEKAVPIGLTRSNQIIFANLEFLDGTRGAHASISGISGVATKTSYATFLLYSLFHSGALGADAVNSKALIFNVKGEDLLWLDRPNTKLTEAAKADYERMNLEPKAFESVALYAPAKKGPTTIMPDTGSRQDGVKPYVWTLRQFAEQRLLRFAFAESEDARAQVSWVIAKLERELEKAVREDADKKNPGVTLDGTPLRSFQDLVDYCDTENFDALIGARIAPATLDAFRRRLHAATQRMGHLVRGDEQAANHVISWEAQQVTVVDIHALHSTAQMFVVGVLLKRMMEEKEAAGSSRPLVFVVLDELNKYAPRSGWSPIGDVILDIAERGRSLGVSLFGAQQTASEVERRVIGNSALRVVGRLDAAEAERGEYRFLTGPAKLRASLLQPGSMIVSQPEIPTPILLRFPFPSWATRRSEAERGEYTEAELFGRMKE